MNIDEFYEKVEGQKDKAMVTFNNNEAVLTGFLKKLMFDETYDNLIQAYFKSEKESMRRSANTLRCLYINLGLTKAANISGLITKSSYYAYDKGIDLGIGQLSVLHNEIIEGIKAL